MIVAWNAAADIEQCLSSITQQSYSNYNVIVLDSASTDNTLEIVRSKFPSVQVIASAQNLGYRSGNRLGMQKAEGDYVVICNDDVVVERDWLGEMVNAMEEDPELGMVTPRIMMYDQPEVMNFAGNTLHYSGLYGPRAKYAPVSSFLKSEDVAAVAGTCFMIRRDLMVAAGGFSEDFDKVPRYWHASHEDVDLGWHVQMMGYRCRYVSSAVVRHKYKRPSRDNRGRFIQLGYGQLLFVLRNFDTSALVLLLPTFLLVEASQFLFAVVKGRDWTEAKLEEWRWFLDHRRDCIGMRQRFRSLRVKSYWQLMSRMSPTIDMAPIAGGFAAKLASAVLNSVFWVHYQLLLLASRLLV